MNRTVSTTNYTNEMIVPKHLDLSWSQQSASLQTSEIRRSMVTKKTMPYVRVGILLKCGKHLYDRITVVRGAVSAHKTCLKKRHFLWNCLYQDMTVSGHVFVC